MERGNYADKRADGSPDDKKKDEKKVKKHLSKSLNDSKPSTSKQQQLSEDEGLGLSTGRKKKKKTHKDRSERMDITEGFSDLKVKERESHRLDTEKSHEVASKQKHGTRKRKETKDDDDDGDGVGGGEKKRKHHKKKYDSDSSSTSGTETPTAQAEKQMRSSSDERLKSTSLTKASGQSKHAPRSESSMQLAHMSPRPSTSRAHSSGQSSGRGYAGERPGSSKPGTKSSLAQSKTPKCGYKIPDKVFGDSVPYRDISVLTNYLKMDIMSIKIHRYDVTFLPEKPRKFGCKAFNMVADKHFSNIPLAFDQRKNVYSLKALPGVPLDSTVHCNATVSDPNEKLFKVQVSFQFTGLVDFNTLITYMKTGDTTLSPPTEAIQAVDVILRQGTLESYVKAGRRFFKRPSIPVQLGEGLEIWTGLFQSAIFTSRPFLNIDVVYKGFPRQQLLIDLYIREFRLDANKTISDQRGRNLEAFLYFLKGLKVLAYVGGDLKKNPERAFVCNGLVEPPRKMFFNMKKGTSKEVRSNVLEYFEKEKNCRIRYPNVNCVWVGPVNSRIYYPMEFLQVAYGQINYSNSEFLKNFGLNISAKFVNLDAKILQPPKIDTGVASVEPRRGGWHSNRLLKAKSLESWGIISVETDPRSSFNDFINMIMRVGKEMGMRVNSPQMVSFNISISDVAKTMQQVKDKGILFCFVIFSALRRDYYHIVKRITEREVGLLTQCIREFTASRKMNQQTARNILLKVNSKLMGINHALDVNSTPSCLRHGRIMLVGADVTHLSPDQNSVPSIAAVTASIDTQFTIYNTTMSIQTSKKQMIVDFENMMVEHFSEFEKRQKVLPSKIYVFRDGVSEGQFDQVMKSELPAIYNAYKRKTGPGSGKRPEVLFLLVQKRHHTRFFVGDYSFNVEPGTVVDDQIVHPKELDFFLVSHHTNKGTARPTRYHVVCNDGRIAQDEVEQLTYYLCHLYARCTRSVSYPTPTYYAHLACMRARSLTFGESFSNAELEESPQRLRVSDAILNVSRMFFL